MRMRSSEIRSDEDEIVVEPTSRRLMRRFSVDATVAALPVGLS